MRLLLIAVLIVAFPALGVAQQAIDPDLASGVTSPALVTVAPSPANQSNQGADAGMVFFDVDGPDNFSTADMYGVSNSGTEAIASISIDISAQAGSFFDFDGSASYGNATAPVVGAIGGMALADITWSYDAGYPYPQTITATFSPAMAPGAFFRFGADTDFFVSDPCPGGNFGIPPATVSATFVSGATCTEPYATISTNRSEATCMGLGFTLAINPDPLISGQNAGFVATNGTPNTNTYLAYSLVGPGSTFVPFLNVTLGLASPKQAGGVMVSDPAGMATWNLFIPPAGAGKSVWFQAAQFGNVSNVVATRIL